MSRPPCPLGAALAAALCALTTLAAPAAAQCEPEWRDLRGGVQGTWSGSGPAALSFFEFDDGSGPALYATGAFRSAGGVPANGLARWDGWGWSRVGDLERAFMLTTFDDGSGPALYGSGQIDGKYCIARWDGASWSIIGRPAGYARRLVVFDGGTGPELYAGGLFSEMDGIRAFNIARWDGVEWRAVGDGVSGAVYDMTVFDDGAGPALYVAGNLTFGSGSAFSRGIVRWDGEAWSGLVGRSVQETMDFQRLAVFDDGSGPSLYGVSYFCDSTGCPRGGGVLRWDGALWQQVGGTFAGWPYTLDVIDDGSGPALFAGGRFISIGGEPIRYLARWDGASWSGFQGGTDAPVRAITAFDEGAGPTIFIGGEFTRAGDIEASGIAAYGCPPPGCYADCDDDGQLNFFDFLCFQNLFAAADPRADCDGSGELDFLDFLCYQNAFIAGCP